MKKIFEKNELFFCILLIIIYILINSFCINTYGTTSYKTALINTTFSVSLYILIKKLDRTKYYGLNKVKNIKKYLYFIPLLLIISVNLWTGINIQNTPKEIIFYMLNMFNIGFIEEIIFRGFLFKMMEKDNLKTAIMVTSITFGIGHIINLLNGSELVPTILQIISAISIGYLFVTIFYKSKSLLPCIVTHSLINALSIFYVETHIIMYATTSFIILISLLYAKYINKKKEA